MSSAFLVISGRLQRASDVIHVVAERFLDLTPRLADMKDDRRAMPVRTAARLQRSRDFH
jgi:error-prone DNA polymerase